MYIWPTAPTFTFDDWKLEVLWSFINALTMMVDGWSRLSSFRSHELIGSLVLLLWIHFDAMFIVELIWVITYPSEVFQVVYPCSNHRNSEALSSLLVGNIIHYEEIVLNYHVNGFGCNSFWIIRKLWTQHWCLNLLQSLVLFS